MKPDQIFETEAERAKQRGAPPDSKAGADPASFAIGATDLIEKIAPASASEWSPVPAGAGAAPQFRKLVPPLPPSFAEAPQAEPAASRAPLPIVHEVVFAADASSSSGASDPLLQLLRSAPSGAKTPEAAPQPQPSKPDLAVSPSSGGFTQLLRALNYEQVKPEQARPEQAKVAEEPVKAASRPPAVVPPPPVVTSLTELLRTINSPGLAEAQPDRAPIVTSEVASTSQLASAPSTAHAAGTRQEWEAAPSAPPMMIEAAPLASPVQPLSFTQVFGEIATRQTQPSPVEEPTPIAKASSGFTQMFEALGEPEVKAVEPATEPPPPAAGSFTQVFESLNASSAWRTTPPAASASDLPVAEPVATPAEPLSPPASSQPQPADTGQGHVPLPSGAGSFTKMFEALGKAPSAEQLRPQEIQPDARAESLRVPESAFAASSPGPSTQMFRISAAQAVVPIQTGLAEIGPASVEPRSAQQPVEGAESFTRIFGGLDVQPDPEGHAASPVPTPSPRATAVPADLSGTTKPGSFTQMFRALDAQAPTPTPTPKFESLLSAKAAEPSNESNSFTQLSSAAPPAVTAPRMESRPDATPPPSAPDSFTSIFRSIDGDARSAEVSAPRDHGTPSAPGSPGEFTRMFSTLPAPLDPSPSAGAAYAQAQDGSFTQLFGTLPVEPAQPQNAPFPPPYRDEVSRQPAPMFSPQHGAADPLFSSAREAGYASPPPVGTPPLPVSPSGGGLTQLLRALDQPAQSGSQPIREPLRSSPQPPGAFTAAYGTLDNEVAPPPSPAQPFQSAGPAGSRDATQAFRIPPGSADTAAPAVSAGPSEFTRILNASMLRESALRRGAASADAAALPEARAAAGPSASPLAAPHLQLPGVQMPGMQMPSAQLSAGGSSPAPHLSVQPARLSVQTPHLPATPQIPQAKLPAMLKAGAAPTGKVQQFLPLLLILIIFLLLAILIAVIFLMKR